MRKGAVAPWRWCRRSAPLLAVLALVAIPVLANHALITVNDTGGANDVNAAQSDLTRLSFDGSHPGTYWIQWSWDRIAFSGANTGDACALFDTDGDFLVNNSLCVQIQDNGSGTAVMAPGFPLLFSCNNARNDRCSGSTPVGIGGTTCVVSTVGTDPFPLGEAFPNDTQSTCQVPITSLTGVPIFATVCSYPSAGNGGNNNPVDCIINPGLSLVDVRATKTDGVASVVAGSSTTYTIVVTDAGPGNAHGTIVTDAAVSGLTKTGLTCTASGGAVCPTGLTVAQLEAGVTVATLPFNGSLTFSVTATVSASGGSVTNSVTATAPAAAIEADLTNNTATDINTVTPGANLGVTKTDGVTSLATGGTTSYTVVVSNAGPSAATLATITDAAAAGLTKTSVSCAAAGVTPPLFIPKTGAPVIYKR